MSSDFFAGQSVLVTGSTGMTGSALTKRLVAEGASVRATTHTTNPSQSIATVEYMSADLTLMDDCQRAVKDMDYVIHCAAVSVGAGSMLNAPMDLVIPNVLMNTQMLAASYGEKVRKFLTLGSTTSYPDTGDRPTKESELLDGAPYEKYFHVGWMKRIMEVIAEMYGSRLESPMITIVLRPTNIYGPLDDFEPATSHVSAALLRKVVERHEPIEVWGTGEDVRDLIFVDDMVDAILQATKTQDSYEVLNIGSGAPHSVNEILQKLFELEDHHPKIEYLSDRPTMIPTRVVDTSKAKSVLGFTAKTSLEEGLRQTIAWYRESSEVSKGTPE